MTKPYPVQDIANFLIQLSIDNEKPLVRLHLQYMLYFINAQFLIEDNAPLFTESFEKWAFGPTVVEIRDSTSQFGAGAITKTINTIKFNDEPFDFDIIPFNSDDIDVDTKNRLAKSFAKLIDYKVFQLLGIVLAQGLYTKDKDAVMTYSAPNYKNSEIRQYFIDNPKEQLWQ